MHSSRARQTVQDSVYTSACLIWKSICLPTRESDYCPDCAYIWTVFLYSRPVRIVWYAEMATDYVGRQFRVNDKVFVVENLVAEGEPLFLTQNLPFELTANCSPLTGLGWIPNVRQVDTAQVAQNPSYPRLLCCNTPYTARPACVRTLPGETELFPSTPLECCVCSCVLGHRWWIPYFPRVV